MRVIPIIGSALFALSLVIMSRPLWSRSGKWWDTSRAGRLHSVLMGAGFAVFSLRLMVPMSTIVSLLAVVLAGALWIAGLTIRSRATGAA